MNLERVLIAPRLRRLVNLIKKRSPFEKKREFILREYVAVNIPRELKRVNRDVCNERPERD